MLESNLFKKKPTAPPAMLDANTTLYLAARGGVIGNLMDATNAITNTGITVDNIVALSSDGCLKDTGGSNGLYVPSSLFAITPGDFTIETWIRYTQTAPNVQLCGQWGSTNVFQYGWLGSKLGYQSPTTQYTLSGITMDTGVWHHIAFVTIGSSSYCYYDGVQHAFSAKNAWTVNQSIPMGIMKVYNQTNYAMAGYIDRFRVSNVGRYTGNFTPVYGDY